MNEQLQKALAEILESVLSAKDFLVAELPDVIGQLLMWKMAMSIAITVGGVVVLLVCYVAISKYVKMWKKIVENDAEPTVAFVVVLGGIAIAVGVDMAINLDWLQIWLAPKVYLIEYAASLAK